MAIVHVEISSAHDSPPVSSPMARESETLTSSPTNQVTAASSESGEFISVTATGGNIYVDVGIAPDAASNPRRIVLDGQTRDFGPTMPGDKIAVVDA